MFIIVIHFDICRFLFDLMPGNSVCFLMHVFFLQLYLFHLLSFLKTQEWEKWQTLKYYIGGCPHPPHRQNHIGKLFDLFWSFLFFALLVCAEISENFGPILLNYLPRCQFVLFSTWILTAWKSSMERKHLPEEFSSPCTRSLAMTKHFCVVFVVWFSWNDQFDHWRSILLLSLVLLPGIFIDATRALTQTPTVDVNISCPLGSQSWKQKWGWLQTKNNYDPQHISAGYNMYS